MDVSSYKECSAKNLEVADLSVEHSQVNMAPKGRRRTFRAHGRINAYMRVPSHIEVILAEKAEPVPKAPSGGDLVKHHKAKLARLWVDVLGLARVGTYTSARENVDDLCDPGSFAEYGALVIAAQRRRVQHQKPLRFGRV